MKKLVCIFGLLILIISCSQKKELTLLEKVDDFTVSECRDNCSIDSVGIRRNEVKNNDLYLKFGYFLNCSWEEAFIETIERRNDTMIIHVDRPHETDTVTVESGDIITEEITHEYPLTSCDCFFFFDLKINTVAEAPKVIRVSSEAERTDYWDQLKQNNPTKKTKRKLYVGMSLETLMGYISRKEYHSDKNVIKLYDTKYVTKFFHNDTIVTKIRTDRRDYD